MVRKAILGMFLMLLMLICCGFNFSTANAQTATPSKAIITVSGIPASTKAFAVEVTVDTAILKLGGVSSDAGGIGLADASSKGVGIFSDMDLPATVKLTVDLTGVAVGMSAVSVGRVLDMLGSEGVVIAGGMASVDISSVTVASSSTSSTSTTSSSSSTGGTGMLSADTITVTINGQSLANTNGFNVTLAFDTADVVTVDTAGLTFMGTGATQLLTEAMGNVLSAAWDGTITNTQAVLTAMLKPGTKSGTTMISVSKIEIAGGTDVTSSVAATVTPSSVTNTGGGGTSTSGGGTFVLIGPTSVVGPGKAAIAFSASGATKETSATLNGAHVDFVDDNMIGIAVVKLPKSGSLALKLKIDKSEVDLGSVSVTAGASGGKPKVNSARAQNGASGTNLRIFGQKFTVDKTTVEIVPKDRVSTSVTVKGKVVKVVYPASSCIPKDSYVNVTTDHGTAGKKVTVSGSCSNTLE